jgi:4-hydroxybenzoate polyprenyltransferase
MVLASDGKTNFTSVRKQRALSERFGFGHFDYVGDSFKDMPVWQDCRRAYLVDVTPKIIKELTRRGIACEIILARKPDLFRNLIRSIRVHQWSKNLLLFVPMITAHKLSDWQNWQASLLAFICFSLCASGVYVQNDLLDLQADRRHLSKKKRPLARGDLPLALGVLLAPLLTFAGLGLAFFLPADFLYLLLIYLVITLAYSFKLKAKVILDVLILAGLYTLRLLAGGAATKVPISPWLMGFSIFIFLSLAFCKRYVEIYRLQGQEQEWVEGRGYHLSDQDLLLCGGMVSGYLSVLVFALYLNSPTVASLYHHPEWLWLICPFFIYWISRVWLWAHRGKMVEDPIFFLFRDRVSHMVGLIVAAILYLAV